MSSPGSGGCWRSAGRGVRGREVPEEAALSPGAKPGQAGQSVYSLGLVCKSESKTQRQIRPPRHGRRCPVSLRLVSSARQRLQAQPWRRSWGSGRDAHLCGRSRGGRRCLPLVTLEDLVSGAQLVAL